MGKVSINFIDELSEEDKSTLIIAYSFVKTLLNETADTITTDGIRHLEYFLSDNTGVALREYIIDIMDVFNSALDILNKYCVNKDDIGKESDK